MACMKTAINTFWIMSELCLGHWMTRIQAISLPYKLLSYKPHHSNKNPTIYDHNYGRIHFLNKKNRFNSNNYDYCWWVLADALFTEGKFLLYWALSIACIVGRIRCQIVMGWVSSMYIMPWVSWYLTLWSCFNSTIPYYWINI